MAKLSGKAITEHDVAEYLATQADLALEVRCVKKCRDQGWFVKHGGTYTDPISKKNRQFDIRARKDQEDRRVYLAIECKALSSSFPLVISRLPRTKEEAFHEVVIAAEPEESFYASMIGRDAVEVRLEWQESYYERGHTVGKHTVQIARSLQNEIITGDAESFDKWSQAIASAGDLVSEAESAHEGSPNNLRLSVILPVLVVPDGTLWVADFDPDGVPTGTPRQDTTAEVFVDKCHWSTPLSYTISHLHVVTVSGLETLLAGFAENGPHWAAWFPMQAIEKLCEKKS